MMSPSPVDAKAYRSNFDRNNGQFAVAVFRFPREQAGMTVNYRRSYVKRSGGTVRLQARRLRGRETSGTWFQTKSLFPSGSICEAVCRVRGGGPAAWNWAAFWTLYDRVSQSRDQNKYYEQDVLETFPDGNFFNRYTVKNPSNNQIRIQRGELNEIRNGKVKRWRDVFRRYRVQWNDTASTFNVNGRDGRSMVVRGTRRAGVRHRMILQNRPWGKTVGKTPENAFLANLVSDRADGFTP